MKDKVLSTIAKHAMLKQGDCVIVGLSGGADSVALLCALLYLRNQLGITIQACHVNHNLRGEESVYDEQFCRQLCSALDVVLIVKSINVMSFCTENGCSVEEGARVLRYAALCEINPQAKVATAHTLSDNAETLLINLIRGTALEGLCGIPPVRDNIIRPLIDCTREEVEAYLAQIGQGYVIDSTNLSNAYTRNRIRHMLMPLIKEINPAFLQAVRRTTLALNADSKLLGNMAEDALARATVTLEKPNMPEWAKRLEKYYPLRQGYDPAVISQLPVPIRLRCYRAMLILAGQRYNTDRLHLIDRYVINALGSLQLDKKTTLYCRQQLLMIEQIIQPPCVAPQLVTIAVDKTPLFLRGNEDVTLKITAITQTEIKLFVNNRGLQFKNAIDCDKINKIIKIRARQAGDRIALAGHNCTHSVKKLLNAQSVLPALRDSLVILSDEQGPVWLEGYGVSERVALTDETRRAVLITIQEE